MWKKDETLVFAQSQFTKNDTLTNFASKRISVDPATPTVFHISHVQTSDEGIYICEALTQKERLIQTWNLTIYAGISFFFH